MPWNIMWQIMRCRTLAEELGKKEDAKLFRKRSMGYKNYFCKEFGTLRPITKEGRFYEPFDPKEGANFAPSPGFHEGNAWITHSLFLMILKG